jgi:hypothetical protein
MNGPPAVTSTNRNKTQKHLTTNINKNEKSDHNQIYLPKTFKKKHHVINILSTQFPQQNN